MKYSDVLIPWKEDKANKFDSHLLDEDFQVEKSSFVQEAMRNPEFDSAVNDVNQRVMEHSNPKDKAAMTAIMKKYEKGELEYEDLSTIATMSVNTYKFLFPSQPDFIPRNHFATICLISLIIFGLIAMRIAYFFYDNFTLLLFIALMNIVASACTFIYWPTQVADIVEKWLIFNNMKTANIRKILDKTTKRTRSLSAFLIGGLIVLVIFGFCLNFSLLATDIVSIIALGASILNKYIVETLAIVFEKRIYYNK